MLHSSIGLPSKTELVYSGSKGATVDKLGGDLNSTLLHWTTRPGHLSFSHMVTSPTKALPCTEKYPTSQSLVFWKPELTPMPRISRGDKYLIWKRRKSMRMTNGKASKMIQLSFLRKLKINKEFCQKIMLGTPFLLIWLVGLTAGLNVDSCLIKELLYGGFGPQLYSVLFYLSIHCLLQ